MKALVAAGLSREGAQLAYMRSLTPDTFDKTMRKEIAELERWGAATFFAFSQPNARRFRFFTLCFA